MITIQTDGEGVEAVINCFCPDFVVDRLKPKNSNSCTIFAIDDNSVSQEDLARALVAFRDTRVVAGAISPGKDNHYMCLFFSGESVQMCGRVENKGFVSSGYSADQAKEALSIFIEKEAVNNRIEAWRFDKQRSADFSLSTLAGDFSDIAADIIGLS
ncbi:hypothetical protein [Actinomyces vulturis]|uniref:hypothetical protein n=1 Tax=Actinomyces vulturis TaxID=1857645 RepID=UPI000835C6F7|nr:hypothetical protein [Actinomyces vulturis]